MTKFRHIFVFALPVLAALTIGLNTAAQSAERHEIDQPTYIEGCKKGIFRSMERTGTPADVQMTKRVDAHCICAAKHVAANFTAKDIASLKESPALKEKLKNIVIDKCVALLESEASN